MAKTLWFYRQSKEFRWRYHKLYVTVTLSALMCAMVEHNDVTVLRTSVVVALAWFPWSLVVAPVLASWVEAYKDRSRKCSLVD